MWASGVQVKGHVAGGLTYKEDGSVPTPVEVSSGPVEVAFGPRLTQFPLPPPPKT